MRVAYITGESASNIGISTQVEVDLDTMGRGVTIEIVRVIVKHLSGSAGHFHMSIGNVSGYTDSTINNIYLADQTNVSGILDDRISDPNSACGFGHTTSDGKLYLKFTPNTGSDNKFSYAIYYKV